MKSGEVCGWLRISRATLQNWNNNDRVTPVRPGDGKRARLLFRRSEVQAQSNQQHPSQPRDGMTTGQKLLERLASVAQPLYASAVAVGERANGACRSSIP